MSERIDNIVFVKTWQTGASVAEIAKALDATEAAVLGKANRLRKAGVPLKEFPRKPRVAAGGVSAAELAALAESLL